MQGDSQVIMVIIEVITEITRVIAKDDHSDNRGGYTYYGSDYGDNGGGYGGDYRDYNGYYEDYGYCEEDHRDDHNDYGGY